MDGVQQPHQTFKRWKPYRYCTGYQKEMGVIGQGKPKKDDDLHWTYTEPTLGLKGLRVAFLLPSSFKGDNLYF